MNPSDSQQSSVRDVVQGPVEGEDWKVWTEFECETILENNCLDNKARFRLSQIWIESEENMDDAVKLLDSIQKIDSLFMQPEIALLLGDRLFSNTHKDFNGAMEFY
jgi:hypothetical protein